MSNETKHSRKLFPINLHCTVTVAKWHSATATRCCLADLCRHRSATMLHQICNNTTCLNLFIC